MPEPSATPTRKITAVGLGGALVTALIGTATWLGMSEPPATLTAALTTLAVFAAGYVTSD